MRRRKTLFIDLDGVLADFHRAALKAHNSDIRYRDIQWDMAAQMGMTWDAFWSPLTFEFWVELDWTVEGREILRMAEDIFGHDHVGILSNPSERRGADAGKRAWVRRHIPKYVDSTLLGAGKHLIASHSKVLLDDFGLNIANFRAAGGYGVLVPRPWNGRHGEVTEADSFDMEALANELLAIVRGE